MDELAAALRQLDAILKPGLTPEELNGARACPSHGPEAVTMTRLTGDAPTGWRRGGCWSAAARRSFGAGGGCREGAWRSARWCGGPAGAGWPWRTGAGGRRRT